MSHHVHNVMLMMDIIFIYTCTSTSNKMTLSLVGFLHVDRVPMHPMDIFSNQHFLNFVIVSSLRILKVPRSNRVPWGSYGRHLGGHLGFS